MGGRRPNALQDPRVFWDHVLVGDGCWEYGGTRHRQGYGRHVIQRRRFLAHRVAYLLWYGEDPGDLDVCHRCDNPPCVRPDHLYLGTHADNIRDAITKGRVVNPHGRETHCPAGHPYDDANTYRSPVTGYRRCRACAKARRATFGVA